MSETEPFQVAVAGQLVEQLRAGTAPWQLPWEPGIPYLPTNPVTHERYRAINMLRLLMERRNDPRWMTYRQAQALGAQVRKGEHGTTIQYWMFTQQRDAVTVQLERPRACYAVVFNAEQIEGLPALAFTQRPWDTVGRTDAILRSAGARTEKGIERAEAILKSSGARIELAGDTAFYSVARDSIRLPLSAQTETQADCEIGHAFAEPWETQAEYYATALRELARWTGHPDRLDRDLGHPRGSEGYALEELRVEIASLILGDELALGHNVVAGERAPRAAYVGHWIRTLQRDPLEVFRAAAAAEKIRDFVLELEPQQRIERPAERRSGKDLPMTVKHESDPIERQERRYLAVPYAERREAFDAGARWDPQRRCWYVGSAAPTEKLARWLPERIQARQSPALDPREEFAAVLRDMGCVPGGDHPIMDGERHRVPVEGDRSGDKSGFYIAHLDGRPAGYVKNHRTGAEIRWKSKGYRLDPAEQAKLRAEAAAKLQQRAAEQQRVYRDTAARLEQELAGLSPATLPTAYMEAKRIGLHPGVYTDAKRKTYIPATDADGKLWTVQSIDAEGKKRFAKGSRKHGCFHAIGDLGRLSRVDVLLIAEGYATAATVTELLGRPAVAAFDAGNLLPVAQALHAKFPDKPVVIVADDDQGQERHNGVNPGRHKAEQAARAVGGRVVLPIFAPAEQRDNPKDFSDFNDLAVRSVLGRDGARCQLQHACNQALREASHRVTRAREEQPRQTHKRARAL